VATADAALPETQKPIPPDEAALAELLD